MIPTATRQADTIPLLGVPLATLDIKRAVERIIGWARLHESRYICACDAHSLMLANKNDSHRAALVNADMVTADGQPLVWLARMRGCDDIGRVSGPDLLPAVCAASQQYGLRHYFFGGDAGVADAVADELRRLYPGLAVAGTETPPFRPMSEIEEEGLERRLRDARVDIMWVALGCPRQEKWMLDHVGKLKGIVLIGVGAAFNMQSKRVSRAPLWMQRAGLEWAYRIACEPRRLLLRYLRVVPWLAGAAVRDVLSRLRGPLDTTKRLLSRAR